MSHADKVTILVKGFHNVRAIGINDGGQLRQQCPQLPLARELKTGGIKIPAETSKQVFSARWWILHIPIELPIYTIIFYGWLFWYQSVQPKSSQNRHKIYSLICSQYFNWHYVFSFFGVPSQNPPNILQPFASLMTSTKFLSSHGAAVNVRKTQRMAAKVMQLFNSPNKLLTTSGKDSRFGLHVKFPGYEKYKEGKCLTIPWCFTALIVWGDGNLSNPRTFTLVRYSAALRPYIYIYIYHIPILY